MRVLLISCFLFLASFGFSQNIQLHFDPRHALYSDESPTNYFTTTFEMFKLDKAGSTFLFVDLDYNMSRGNIGLAYMEIARDFKIKKFPIMAHIEFNGGIGKTENNIGFSIENAYLVGASYNVPLNKGNISTYLVYRYNAFERVSNDIQWTATWRFNFFKDKLTLCGFVDLWSENKIRAEKGGDKKVIFITEPQFWYNVNKHLSFGTEVEISNNFYSNFPSKVYVQPTIAVKWTF